MLPAPELLRQAGIHLTDFSVGNHEVLCPRCSAKRKKSNDPCLSVLIKPDGGAAWKCWNFGCDFTGPSAGDGGAAPRPNGSSPDGFRYGNVRKVPNKRWKPGDKNRFYWLHYDGGDWKKGKGRHDLSGLMYRLEEALAQPGKIAVAEGESDVNALWQLGIPATCNAHGAPQWNAKHSAQLAGRDLVVFFDLDEPGRAQRDKVCALSAGHAKSVTVVDLTPHYTRPIKDGDDVRDWLKDGGGTPEKLRELFEQTTAAAITTTLSVNDFYAYAPEHNYIYKPTGQRWPAASVDGRLGKVGRIKASRWLDRNNPVEQMTWFPGEPPLIKDKLIKNGGWFEHEGAAVFNLYQPPHPKRGDANNAERWVEHVRKVYPTDADHLIKWFAHRCQHPHIKINHALFLGGAPGIGKDTLLEPVRHAVGYWNCDTITPTQLLGRFNGFVKTVILVISEARDLGEVNRPQFYEHTKLYTASPPEVIMVDEKNTHPYYVPNVCGAIITSNHKAGGIYLPADDRRTYVAWSNIELGDFDEGYFTSIWNYFARGGYDDITSYLMTLDVTEFDPKSPPPKTPAFWDIVAASRAPEATEMADTLDQLGWPDCVTLFDLWTHAASPEFADWLKDRKNRRLVPAHLEKCEYANVVNEQDKRDGLWMLRGKRQAVYAKTSLTYAEQVAAVWKKRDNSI